MLGVVGVDVIDDLAGRTCDVDLVGSVWDIDLPGQVNNGVQDHLAMGVGDEDRVVVKESGGLLLRNKLMQAFVSKCGLGGVVGDPCVNAYCRLFMCFVCGTYICVAGSHQQTQQDYADHLECRADGFHIC